MLEGYLKQWVRHSDDNTNRPALANIVLRESIFGLGMLHDMLVVEAGVRGKEINVLLALKVVEGVLGYELVGDGNGSRGGGSVWEYRRVRAFK